MTPNKVIIKRSELNPITTREGLETALRLTSGVVKVVTGVGNSAAHLVMLHAHDQIKRHPSYKHKVKRAYHLAFFAMDAYRRNLLFPQNGMALFNLDNLPPKERARFAPDATDADYFDYWNNSGAVAYERTKPFITSLWNKYRISLVSHDIPGADALAWVMTAAAALRCAVELYNYAIRDSACGNGIPEKLLRRLFGGFDLSPVCERWERALSLTEPLTSSYELSEIEERNILNGLDQLMEQWISPDNLFGSTVTNIQDYDEMFSTKGNQKRAATSMAEVLKCVKEELTKSK